MIPPSLRASLYLVLGPGSYSGQLFADLCDQLLLAESTKQGFDFWTPSDRAGDYRSLDAFSLIGSGGNFDGVDGMVGFQYKFVPGESGAITPSQKTEISNSLKKAKEENKDLRQWTLITPEDFNKHQTEWLQGLANDNNCPFPVKHWGQKQLSTLITQHPELAAHVYPDLTRGVTDSELRDFSTRVVSTIRSDPVHSRYYVPLKLEEGSDVDHALVDFVESSRKRLFCLLGSYGTGKTTALEHFSAALANRFSTQGKYPIPVFVRLRHVKGTQSFRHNVIAYLKSEYGLNADFATITALNADGKLLLIFDGLDEKHNENDRRLGRLRLREVFEFSSPTGKLVLSCRSEFFKDVVDERVSVLNDRQNLLVSKANLVRSTDDRGVIGYLSLLDTNRIEYHLNKRLGSDKSEVQEIISTIYDLSDISRRPVMLNMVCETVPHLRHHGDQIVATDLYDLYVSDHAQQDASTHRFTEPLESKRAIIRRLAEHLLLTSRYRIHYSEIAKELQISSDVDLTDFLSTSFLIRDSYGNFEFSHRSFLEFFGAECMFRTLRYGDGTRLWEMLRVVTPEQWNYLDQMIDAAWRDGHPSSEIKASSCISAQCVNLCCCPVTTAQFQRFIDSTGYLPLSKSKVDSFAAVTYYDAVAYTLHVGARMSSCDELTRVLRSEWSHLKQPPGRGWTREICSPNGFRCFRGNDEWVQSHLLVNGWGNFSGLSNPAVRTIRQAVPASRTAIFRCAFAG